MAKNNGVWQHTALQRTAEDSLGMPCTPLLPKSMRLPTAPSFGSRSPPTLLTTSRTVSPELGCSTRNLPNVLNPSLWSGPINFSLLQFPRTLNSKILGLYKAIASMPSTAKRTGRMFPRSFPSALCARLTGPVIVMEYLNNFLVMVLSEWLVKSTQSKLLFGIKPLANSPIAYSKSGKAN